MTAPHVLILGGTAEARVLADTFDDLGGVRFTSSLAGRVSRPRLPVGPVRIGGFGGVAGLAAFLKDGAFTHLVDATHPFAVTMTANAAAASDATGIPAIRLARPGWGTHADALHWTWVDAYDEARTAVENLGACRPFLTSGRQTLDRFAGWAGARDDARQVLVRVVEPLDEAPPPNWHVILDRGPFDVDGERALLREHGIDALVTKDSGGSYTAAKLIAARDLGVPVVVVRRPAVPPGLPEAGSVAEVLDVLDLRAGRTSESGTQYA